MNIVIFAGGTGSIALQTGLYELLDSRFDGIDTKVIVNAYDNGLSTGAVRRVMNGQILGPSDVRKNQTTRLTLENPHSPWLKFLNIRFTVESAKAKAFCEEKVEELASILKAQRMDTSGIETVRGAVDAFFNTPISSNIDYDDFSIANIVYAGLAKQNDFSLRAAASAMAKVMGIKDNVLLNDDTSLFLGAITKSGLKITDEGDIVSWGNEEDPFVQVFFTDETGMMMKPVLCNEAISAIENADLIILSSGTQWSSLIPTYESHGFKRTLRDSTAKIVMVMNRQPDHDSPGQTASEIIDVLVPKYFPEKRLNVILDSSAHPNMRELSKSALEKVEAAFTFDLSHHGESRENARVHSSRKLASAIGSVYFNEFLNSDYFVFDYDDTLVGRGNQFPKSSEFNAKSILTLKNQTNVAICTGNSIKAVKLRQTPDTFYSMYSFGEYDKKVPTTLTVYADGGVNKYEYNTVANLNPDDSVSSKLVECVDASYQIEADVIRMVISSLLSNGIPFAKIENRGDVVVAIKPIDQEYRPIVFNLVRMIVQNSGFDLEVKQTGRTTIEISRNNLTKVAAVNHIISTENPTNITFVGDEMHEGNDASVMNANIPGVKCLAVKNPPHTAFFLATLAARLREEYLEKTSARS